MKKAIRAWLFKSVSGYVTYKCFKYSFYCCWSLLTAINHYVVKYHGIIRGCYSSKLIHLGCGNVYLDGWINIDNYIGKRRKKDVWLDITNGLPFKDSEIQGIFTSHTLEHFTIEDIIRILKECYRVLKSGGYFRIAVPSFTLALNAYFKQNFDFFQTEGQTISRRFIDQILWHNTHLTMFDFDFMRELLEDSGFRKVKEVKFRDSYYFDHSQLIEMDKYKEVTMFIECIK